jgi:uncharacterized protein with von Willebrand factor type A (vWA) domain
MRAKLLTAGLGLGLLLAGGGCSSKSVGTATNETLAKSKLATLEKLADLMDKNPTGAEAYAAFDEFRNTYFDAQAQPQEVNAILDLYAKRIRGKHKGQIAQELQAEINILKSNAGIK